MEQKMMRTWAEVDLGSIKANIAAIRAALPQETKYMAVVKANAYGHGAVPVARAALEAGAGYLAVACIAEAAELRAAGITAPVLILGVTPAELAGELVELGVTQAVSSLDYARALNAALNAPLKVHLKLETGMGRTGFHADKDALGDIAAALSLKNLCFEGVFTHFAVSDCPEDEEYTRFQHRRFEETVRSAEALRGERFELIHCANSGAVLNFREYAYDMARPGVIMYGMYPGAEHGGIELRPAMSLRSRVYALTEHEPGDTISYGRTFTARRKTRLAVVPIGYADGLHRVLSNKMDVLIRGVRCPQVGRICMDMCMVDVTDLPECAVGDVVTIIGRDGDEEITAAELAALAGTINYEVTCDITARVPRIYR
jgi:alanine racemase